MPCRPTVVIALAVVAAACVPPGGQPAGGQASGPITPTGADQQLADRFRAAGDRCGALGKHTVPAGWNLMSVGTGCTGWAPASWRIGPPSETITTATAPRDVAGFLQMRGVPPTPITCSSRGVAEALMRFVNSQGCAGARLIAYGDTVMDAVGTRQPMGLGIFTCSRGPQPFIGFTLSTGTYEPVTGICNMWIQAYWLAQSLIDSDTCLLKQIGASIQCTASNPMADDEAGCWPDRCAEHCAAEGRSGSCDGPVCRCE